MIITSSCRCVKIFWLRFCRNCSVRGQDRSPELRLATIVRALIVRTLATATCRITHAGQRDQSTVDGIQKWRRIVVQNPAG